MKHSLTALVLVAASCSSDSEPAATGPELIGSLDPAGGTVAGSAAPFEGVSVTSAAGAATAAIAVRLTPLEPEADDALPPLPAAAERIGAGFRLSLSATPKSSLTVTLPADLRAAAAMGQDYRQVKVWRLADDAASWKRLDALETGAGDGAIGSVSVSVVGGGVLAAGVVVEPPPCDDCVAASVELRPLPGVAVGSWLDCRDDLCGALVAANGQISGVLSGPDGVALTASLSTEATSRLWPARGLCVVDDGHLAVALSDRLVVLSAGGVAEQLTSPLAVLRAEGQGFLAAVDVSGTLHLQTFDAALKALADSATSLTTPPLSALAGAEPLVVAGADRVLIGDEEVPLNNARPLAVTEHGLSLDADGQLRTAQGLPFAQKLVGARFRLVAGLGHDRLVAADRTGAGLSWITSTYKPATPADKDRFEASEVLKLTVSVDGAPAVARALARAGDQAAMLTRDGRLVLFAP